MKIAFPELKTKELRKIERNFYKHLSDCMVETIKLKRLSERQLEKRMRMKNIEAVNHAFYSGTPVIIMLGHIGNWEWLPHFTTYFPSGIPFGEIYRHLHDKGWEIAFHNIRSRWQNVTLLPQKIAFRTILNWNEKGNWGAAFLADQRPNGKNPKVWMRFFDKVVPVSVGAEQIGGKLHARYFYGFVTKPKRGYYDIEFKEISNQSQHDQIYPVTEKYISLLEDNIRKDPAIWLWSHNRWKFQK